MIAIQHKVKEHLDSLTYIRSWHEADDKLKERFLQEFSLGQNVDSYEIAYAWYWFYKGAKQS